MTNQNYIDMKYNSSQLNSKHLATLIHQAALSVHVDLNILSQICDAALHFNFSGLCTNLNLIPAARQRLGPPGPTKLIAVIAFPFGAIPSSLKKAEAEWAAAHGAEELDIVPNFWALSQNKVDLFAEELADLCELGLPVRAILDISHLPKEKLSLAIDAAIDAGVSGLQSGNGFGPTVTGLEIRQLADLTKGRSSIKAVGGIKSIDQAIELLNAGATTLGTSCGTDLMAALKDKQ